MNQFLVYVTPIALALCAILAARILRLVTQHIKDRRLALALELATYGAAAVVADFAQRFVHDLKDPSKPGQWTSNVASSVRLQAIARVRELYPAAVKVITESLGDAGRVDDLLGTLVERAVVEQKKGTFPVGVVTDLVAGEPPVAERTTTLPSNPQGGYAATGPLLLLLLMLAATVALAACPKVIREPEPVPPRDGCVQGATTCHEGHPWVCGPEGKWSRADRRCDRLGARCCLAASPYDSGLRHACVPAAACVEVEVAAVDGGAP